MATLATRLSDLATAVATAIKSTRTLLNGNAADNSALTTTAKNNLVAAINEVKATADGKQAALGFTPENVANKGQANGYAGLDGGGKVPAAQLPSYVDDVLEYANLAAFPASGETGKIYVAIDTNAEYRWSGTQYVKLVASPGTTDNVPEGANNLYYTDARSQAAARAIYGDPDQNLVTVFQNGLV